MVSDGTLEAVLIDARGVTVLSMEPRMRNAGWHKETLDIHGLATGVYVLKVMTGNEMVQRKVIISANASR
jgi:hypothetical protein